eukprot:scaffold1755_cov202-Prasinococcus_capsulatus_cf.AAC.4
MDEISNEEVRTTVLQSVGEMLGSPKEGIDLDGAWHGALPKPGLRALARVCEASRLGELPQRVACRRQAHRRRRRGGHRAGAGEERHSARARTAT